MATRSVTARVALDGEKEYKQALQELNAGNRTLATEMKKLQAEYKGNTESTEYLTKAGDLLQRRLLSQQEKVQKLREAVAYAAKAYGESSTTTQKYIQQLNMAEAAEFDLQHAIEENTKALQGEDDTMVGLGDTAQQLADKLGIRLPEGATKALNGMKGLSAGTVAAMAAAAAAIAAVVKVVSDLGQLTLDVAADVDSYMSESQITGVPVEMLQAWDYAAPLIDVDAETMKSAMTKLTKAMGDAAGGSESAQEQFEALGVSIVDQTDGSLRSAEEVFYDVIDAMGGMEAGAARDAAAMELMGKSAQDLNPLINAGSSALKEYEDEAKAAGYILDEYQIKRLADVDDAYQRLQLTIEANKKQLAADFAPAAETAMKLFTDAVQTAGEMLKRSGLIEYFVSIIQSLLDILQTGGKILAGLPGLGTALDTLNAALQVVAYTCATIADTIKIIVGLNPGMWGSGLLKEGLGLSAKEGRYSNLQRLNGTATTMEAQRNGYRGNGGEDMSKYGYDPKTGLNYDLITGNYIYPGHNATGTADWRGGLTWVGEAGPELVNLPRGSQILNAQDSRSLGGDTFYITIDAASVREFNDIVEMAQSARVQQRMR